MPPVQISTVVSLAIPLLLAPFADASDPYTLHQSKYWQEHHGQYFSSTNGTMDVLWDQQGLGYRYDSWQSNRTTGGDISRGKVEYREESTAAANSTYLNFIGHVGQNFDGLMTTRYTFSGSWTPPANHTHLYMGFDADDFNWAGIDEMDVYMRLTRGTTPEQEKREQWTQGTAPSPSPGNPRYDLIDYQIGGPAGTTYYFEMEIIVKSDLIASAIDQKHFGTFIGSQDGVAVPAPMASGILGFYVAALGGRRRR